MPATLMQLTRHCCVNNNKQWFINKGDKVAIKVLRQEKGYGVKSLVTSF